MPDHISLPSFSELLAYSFSNGDQNASHSVSPHALGPHNDSVPLILPSERPSNDYSDYIAPNIPPISLTNGPTGSLCSPPIHPPSASASLRAWVPFDAQYLTGRACPNQGYQFVRCPRCEREYKVLVSNPNLHWTQHLEGDKCKNTQRRLEARRVREDAEQAHRELFSASFGSTSQTHLHVRAVSSPVPARG